MRVQPAFNFYTIFFLSCFSIIWIGCDNASSEHEDQSQISNISDKELLDNLSQTTDSEVVRQISDAEIYPNDSNKSIRNFAANYLYNHYQDQDPALPDEITLKVISADVTGDGGNEFIINYFVMTQRSMKGNFFRGESGLMLAKEIKTSQNYDVELLMDLPFNADIEFVKQEALVLADYSYADDDPKCCPSIKEYFAMGYIDGKFERLRGLTCDDLMTDYFHRQFDKIQWKGFGLLKDMLEDGVKWEEIHSLRDSRLDNGSFLVKLYAEGKPNDMLLAWLEVYPDFGFALDGMQDEFSADTLKFAYKVPEYVLNCLKIPQPPR